MRNVWLAAIPLLLWAQPTLESWKAAWSPYRIVDDRGAERRLLKATIEFVDPSPAGWRLAVRGPNGQALAVEPIPPGKKGAWAHGFWLPPGASALQLELRRGNAVVARKTDGVPPPSGAVVSHPLRLDRLDRGLLQRLIERESAALPAESANVVSYLRQHDVVYQRPAPSWVEGLPLGNGDIGALVSGIEGKEQVFHLDKTDIWLATADDHPLGRSYAGTLRVRYRGGRPFSQRLSLGEAEVTTQDGAFKSSARVDAMRNALEIEIQAPEIEISLERQPSPLWMDWTGYRNSSRLYGSWATFITPEIMEKIRAEVARAPHTKLDWGHAGRQCWFTQTAPNVRYAVSVNVEGAEVVWSGCAGRVRASANGPIRLRAAIATSRETRDPTARARELAAAAGDRQAHLDWWRAFWSRSWIELPDKLEENLWYLGLYQQAACSRSEQAVSFFGLWHPLDHRTWFDAYVADAQVPMIWWLCFGANHLELLYPSHRTFGRLAAEFVKHTPGEGMVVPHFAQPEWAGGRGSFVGTNPHKGSSAWYTMNFWWDYLYSGDVGFLRDVTYPMLRMTADQLVSQLVKGADGRYHCLNSGSPEQNDTGRDNIYDWAMLRSFFRSAIRAADILGADADERAVWRDRLDNLFPPPTDGKTLWEAPNNPHPYRCHPVIFFPLHPTNAVDHGSPLFEAARRTMPVVTRLIGFRFEDRHAAIPNFEGGVEPNGFSSGILTINAARLGDRDLYRRFLYGLIVRFHLKQNGLRALLDTRQSEDISRASLVEAANAHTVAITETLVQSWDDHIRIFPCVGQGRYRFSGLRAAGGAVISAEALDGRLRWAQVKALRDGVLRIAIPGEDRLRELKVRPGETYNLAGKPDFSLAPAEPRGEPRRIPITSLDDGSLVHYPENLPFGQVVEDEHLYLGRPARFGQPRPAPDLQALLANARGATWQERQRAARLLASVKPSPEVLATLDRLCADPVNIVAHTAAVALIHLRTAEALAIAQKHADKDAVSGLRREVEKALKRAPPYYPDSELR